MYILIFLASQLSAGVIPFVVPALGGQQVTYEWTLVMALFFANLLAILLFFCYRPQCITWKNTMAGFKGRAGHRTLLTFLLAIPLIFLVNLAQEAFFPNLPNLVGDETMKAIMYNPLGLVTVSIIGPLAEELLFRGGLQTDFQDKYSTQGAVVAIGLSAGFFSLIHLNPAQMPAAFILGCALGFAYWWTESLVAPILIHVFNNSFACIMSLLSPDDDSLIHFLGGPSSAGIVAIVCLFFLIIVLRAVRKEGLFGTEKG